MALIRALEDIRDELQAAPKELLALKLSCLLMLFRGYGDEAYLFPVNLGLALLSMLMLLSRRLLVLPWAWALQALVLAWLVLERWHAADNHQWLMMYWTLSCALVLRTDRVGELLPWNATLLIGLIFALATAWKTLAGEYLDGSFFHIVFLEGHELRGLGAFLGGLPGRVAEENLRIVQHLNLLPPGDVSAALTSTSGVRLAALLISYSVLVLEGAISAAFLGSLASRAGRLAEHRDILLLTFIVTTFSFAQVIRFASLLTILGIAQCERPRLRLAYLSAFLYVIVAHHLSFNFLKTQFLWSL